MCNLNQLIWLITGAILALTAAMALAVASTAIPDPGNLIALLAAVAAAAGALVLFRSITTAFNEYAACRDGADGASTCSTAIITGLTGGIGAVIGTAFASYVAAAAANAIPVIGRGIGTIPLNTAFITSMIAIGLLTALLAALLAYRDCRDAAVAGLGGVGAIRQPGGPGVPGVGTVTRPGG